VSAPDASATPQVLVLAKAPVPGRVKTRLCPPCTPVQAARVAAAALADTLDTVTASAAGARSLVVDGRYPVAPGWATLAQRGGPLGERLAGAFADTSTPPGTASVLIGMDTPQVTAEHLDTALWSLGTAGGPDAVLGPAADGGWWALGLRDPGHAAVLRTIPTSTATTGRRTLAALRRRGLRVTLLPRLRDVDTAADARAVAALCPPGSRFAGAVAAELGEPVAAR
jgi:rSAM/selenodomain-associated transferase 1